MQLQAVQTSKQLTLCGKEIKGDFNRVTICGIITAMDSHKALSIPYGEERRFCRTCAFSLKECAMRNCDDCTYYAGEWCGHPEVKEKEKTDTMYGDLWREQETPSWCPLHKQTL